MYSTSFHISFSYFFFLRDFHFLLDLILFYSFHCYFRSYLFFFQSSYFSFLNYPSVHFYFCASSNVYLFQSEVFIIIFFSISLSIIQTLKLFYHFQFLLSQLLNFFFYLFLVLNVIVNLNKIRYSLFIIVPSLINFLVLASSFVSSLLYFYFFKTFS